MDEIGTWIGARCVSTYYWDPIPKTWVCVITDPSYVENANEYETDIKERTI